MRHAMVRIAALVLVVVAGAMGSALAGAQDDLELGAKAADAGDYDRAIELLTRALAANELSGADQAAAHYKRGDAYAALGDYDQAIPDYDAMIGTVPGDAAAHIKRADAYQTKGKYDLAIADYEAAIRLDPGSDEAFSSRGDAYAAKGDYARAIADYNAAVRLKPDDADAYLGRGAARFVLGQFGTAIADLRHSAELDPENAYAVLWLYLAEARSGKADHVELVRLTRSIDRDEWPGPVVDLYLGDGTEQEVRDALDEDDADQRCEMNFYLGEYGLTQNNKTVSVKLLQAAAATCPAALYEHQGALAELKRIGN